MSKIIRLAVLFCVLAPAAFAEVWTNIGDVDALGFFTLSASQTWVCTTSGRIYFYDGETLSEQAHLAPGGDLSLQDIYALDGEHVWAVGYSYSPSPVGGQVFFYDGAEWRNSLSLTNAGQASHLYGVYAASTSHIWACGNLAQIWATTNGGSTWTTQYTHADTKSWYAIDGVNDVHVWVAGMEYVGKRAQIMAFNGMHWLTSYSEVLDEQPLRDIDAVSTNDVWAIGGSNGTVIHFQNGAWTAAPALNSTNANSYSINRTPYGDVWASAYGQGLFYLAGDEWTRDTGLSIFAWRSYASTWYVFVQDALSGVFMRRIYPAVDRVSTGIGFSWNSVPGRIYQIEWTDDLIDPTWRAADRITAGGWTTYWGDIGDGTTNRPPPASSTQRLYRVVQP